MTEHQRITLTNLTGYAEKDPTILGVILYGSLARGGGTRDSDVDILLVVTQERFQKAMEEKDYFWGNGLDRKEFPTEVDGKIVPKEFLERIGSHGDESLQSSLSRVKLLYCRDDDIPPMLEKAITLSEEERLERIRKFYALMKSSRYIADENMDNPFYYQKCIWDMVFYAVRLLLEHNRILFPCAKNAFAALNFCDDLPVDFVSLCEELLKDYSLEKADHLYGLVNRFSRQYHYPDSLRKGYVIEDELFWFFDNKPFSHI